MKLAEALHNNRYRIVDRWVEYTLSTYTSSNFFKKEKDQFANPIGGSVRNCYKALFPLLIKGGDDEQVKRALSHFMHLRAVQEFSPSQAIAPLSAVKHITRDILGSDKETRELVSELYDFEFAVDLALFKAFDLYMECKMRVYDIRIREIKSGSAILTDSTCPSKVLTHIKGLESIDSN